MVKLFIASVRVIPYITKATESLETSNISNYVIYLQCHVKLKESYLRLWYYHFCYY